MATCKTTLYRAVKVSRVDGTVTPVGDAFNFDGTTLDPALYGACPDVSTIANSVCITTTGADCLEGVKQICQVTYDCTDETSAVTVLGYVLPDSSFVAAADAVSPFTVIPCPIVEIVSDTRCELPA